VQVGGGSVRHTLAMPRRVVVTGLGLVSAFGNEVDGFWDALLAGRSAATETLLEGLPPVPTCRVPEFPLDDVISRRDAKRMDRVGMFAAVATAAALTDAGLHGIPSERFGAAIGCAHGGAATVEEAQRTLRERGLDRVSPFAVPLGLVNSAVAGVARVHGLRGPSSAPATACAAGSDAIGFAYERIRDGRADAMAAGGAEAAIVPSVIAGYLRLGAIASLERGAAAASRPFDAARDGFVMAEGAGVLVLEEREHAEARGARIYAELVGYGQSCDAGHMTSPDDTGDGPARAVAEALAEAGIEASAVGYVNAHATSTPVGDRAEAIALRRAGGCAGLVDQGSAWPHAGRSGWHRGDRDSGLLRPRPAAAVCQPRRVRRRARPRANGTLRSARVRHVDGLWLWWPRRGARLPPRLERSAERWR